MLAGLPPVVGLYASIMPLVLYAIFGTSRTLAVGPVTVVSLMTASAAGAVAPVGMAVPSDQDPAPDGRGHIPAVAQEDTPGP